MLVRVKLLGFANHLCSHRFRAVSNVQSNDSMLIRRAFKLFVVVNFYQHGYVAEVLEMVAASSRKFNGVLKISIICLTASRFLS